MEGIIIDLYKHTGAILVGVNCTWIFLAAKYVLAMLGLEAKEACGTEQVCEGMEALI